MKKTWKRLCTGFLALATVVTALPTTPVHAESKQYWTESAERVGIIEKVMNAYRLGAFQLVRKRLDAFPLQLHNHTDSDWCLCIGRFSVLPLLLRQFQEAPAPSKAGKNDTGK